MASQLIERLLGQVQPRIPQHDFAAALGEFQRGELSGAEASSLFGLTGDDATEAASLAAKITPPTETVCFGGYLVLTNVGANYDTIAPARGLGIAQVEIGGITSITFGVRVNKVGSGTQSWQLWNDTDGAEIAVINDAAAAGDNKLLSTTVNFDPPLSPGTKVIRVRVKSTTAADDPVYYGGSLLIRRHGVFTSAVLHELFLLGDRTGYNTPAAMRARLGL